MCTTIIMSIMSQAKHLVKKERKKERKKDAHALLMQWWMMLGSYVCVCVTLGGVYLCGGGSQWHLLSPPQTGQLHPHCSSLKHSAPQMFDGPWHLLSPAQIGHSYPHCASEKQRAPQIWPVPTTNTAQHSTEQNRTEIHARVSRYVFFSQNKYRNEIALIHNYHTFITVVID